MSGQKSAADRKAHSKRVMRGQCCEKKVVLDTTFYCVEMSGHQCPHHYTVNMSDLERLIAIARVLGDSTHTQSSES